MSTKFKYDVFLSHNHADKPKVRRLAEKLKAAGLRVWLDEWVVQPGDIIALKVDEGLEQSRTLLLCISPAALASGWVALERSTAIHRDPANTERRFIPLLLEDCELPDTLRRYKYLDFTKENEETITELLAAAQPEKENPVLPINQEIKPKGKSIRIKKTTQKPKTEPLAVLERKLKGHEDWVKSLAISPDGKWLASGSGDRTVRVWDMESGDCRALLKGHEEHVQSVVFSRDGSEIFSGSRDMTIRRWGLLSFKVTDIIKGHTYFVTGLAVSTDGKTLISCSGNEGPPTIRIWDIATNKANRVFKDDDNDAIFSIALSSSNAVAVSGGGDSLVKVWDLESGTCVAKLKGHSNDVMSVAITSDGRLAVSGSKDKTVKIWDIETGTCLGTLEGHTDVIHSVAISPDDRLIASVGFTDETVRLWDLKTGACLEVIGNKENASPIAVAFSPDGTKLVVGTYEGAIYLYRLSVKSTQAAAENPRYVNAKIVLLGEGTVGKTSLAHRLMDDEYVIKDRTHGMNVWRMHLPLPPDHTLEREALLWDLAGQEDYRLIHQLFLDETTLALLLVNPQKEDPFTEAGDWLKALKTAAHNQASAQEAARLLIFSQTDVGGMKLSNAKIDRFIEQYGFAGWLPTSAKTGENCSDKVNGDKASPLKELIAKTIAWDKLPWTTTPPLLSALKNALMNLRDKEDIRLLRFAELAQRLEQSLPGEKIEAADVRTAVTLLANHGLARPLKFGDLVLLRPDLINGYAGAVIRAARAHTDEIGCVPEAAIYSAEFDFTGVERLLHRPDEELLLRALVQIFLDHSLCIAEDTPQGRHLVFPSQYRREKDTPKNPDIFVSYTFSGEWQSVWTTLVVRLWYSQEFGHRELWRNAAEFETSKQQTLGIKIEKQGDGAATISLYFDMEVPDELKVIFIEYVHRHLAKYGCDVVRDRRYICSNLACKKPVTDIEIVRKRLEEKKNFIYCQGCDEKVPLIDFIEQRLKSDPVAQKILAMEATATHALDTQALEQILMGHMMAISGEANQIFRPTTMFDHGIDGELEFKDNDGRASGKKIYIQLKSGNSYLRTRKKDGSEVFDISNDRHLEYWVNQPVDVFLVIRLRDERSNEDTIRWMNITQYLNNRKDKKSRQIIFSGEKLDVNSVWNLRDKFFPPERVRKT